MSVPPPNLAVVMHWNLPSLDTAILLAAMAHAGQRDKQDKPYILHPLAVMEAMHTEEEKIVAVLHDALEDTPEETRNEWVALLGHVFGGDLELALTFLTRKSTETYDQYIGRVLQNHLATRVKLEDATHNLYRVHGLPEGMQDGLRRRYEKVIDRCLDRLMDIHMMGAQ